MDNFARWTSGDTIRLALVLLFAAAYRWYYLTGFMPPDSMVYTQYAYNVLQGTFTLDSPSWYTHRFTVFIPIAPFYVLMGVGKLSTFAYTYILSLVQILILVWFGRRFFGVTTALLAALLLSFLPLDVAIAGRLVPDVIIATFTTIAMFSWFAALEGREKPHRGLLLCSGFFFCLAVLSRPYALIFGLAYLMYWICFRNSWRSVLWTIAGFGALAIPVFIAYEMQTGDALYRLAVAKHLGEHFGYPEWKMAKYVRSLWHPETLMGLFAYLFVFTHIVAFVSRSRSRILMLVWTVPFALFLQFGSMNLTRFVPITKELRYLSPLLVPSCLIAASVLQQVVPRVREKLAASVPRARVVDRTIWVAVLVVLLVSSTLVLNHHQSPGRVWYRNSVDVATVLKENSELPVLSDHWRTMIRMAYFLEYEEGADFYWGIDDYDYVREPGVFGDSRLGYAAWYQELETVPDALVVVDEAILRAARARTNDEGYYKGVRIPSYCFEPPSSWELLSSTGDLKVYRTRPSS